MNLLRYISRYIINFIFFTLASSKGKKMQNLNRVLIIAPHPDDEILGCGGFITTQNLQNKEVFIIFLTKGENCNPEINPETLITERRILSEKALTQVHQPMFRVYYLDFVDGEINNADPEVNKLKSLLIHIDPEAIFVPNLLEGWNDHINANTIIKSLIDNKSIKIFEYCVWFWYTTPLRKISEIKWKNAQYTSMENETMSIKQKAIDIYMKEKNINGIPYSGALPPILLKYSNRKKEIYFLN